MRLSLAATLYLSLSLHAQTSPPAWIQKSNANTQLLLRVEAKWAPESAASLGLEGLDDKISIPSPERPALFRADLEIARKELESRLASETDPLIKQDLAILIDAANRQIRTSQVYENNQLSYASVAQMIFGGIHSLLDEQITPERRPAAVVRLRRYTGSEQGYQPTTLIAEEVFRARVKDSNLIGPSKLQVENDLEQADHFVTGIGLLLEKYKLDGYQDSYAKLKQQIAQYQQFTRDEVLPHARSDFRLPPALYQINLENAGVDYSRDQLTSLAHASFSAIQGEMRDVARRVASQHHLPSDDYRSVIRDLKKDQLPAEQILPVYKKTLSSIEDTIRRQHLVSLPSRPAIIRLASAAETAQQPAPHMRAPQLINNTGQRGEFVLPMGVSGAGGRSLKYDDFTFNAATWTLTAHEARPGHELQFDTMVERGIPLARAVYAFNSTNVEGWGLYSEWMILPYMPDEAKLISLQLRLLRAARAFLDPELQSGKVTPAEAQRILEQDVVCSEAFATEEVQRFTFRMPGQAVSYFDGYTRMRELRTAVESALGPKFNAQRFHDFVLDQGLLPPALLRKAVMETFVPEQLGQSQPKLQTGPGNHG